MAHHGLREFDQPRGNATAVHQLAGEHEKRNGHQREAVHAVIDVAVEQRHVALLTIQPEQYAWRGKERKNTGSPTRSRIRNAGRNQISIRQPHRQQAPCHPRPGWGAACQRRQTLRPVREINSTLTMIIRHTPVNRDIYIQASLIFTDFMPISDSGTVSATSWRTASRN